MPRPGRITGPAGWYWVAGMRADWGCELIQFAMETAAKAMQRWIAESGIETRPAPGSYNGPQLSAYCTKTS
ncbi:hypothetical protein [Reyranella sp.]|uniref:hypothetical protein n=1 Tax=Reyranella sp. TaxID=1929291 RepID=UPI003D0FAA7D